MLCHACGFQRHRKSSSDGFSLTILIDCALRHQHLSSAKRLIKRGLVERSDNPSFQSPSQSPQFQNPRRSFLWLRLWQRSRQPLVCLLRCAKAAREAGEGGCWQSSVASHNLPARGICAEQTGTMSGASAIRGPLCRAFQNRRTCSSDCCAVARLHFFSRSLLIPSPRPFFPLSRRLGPVEISPLVHHLYWMCLFGGDAPSLRYPAT